MRSINIYFGSDADFCSATENLDNYNTIGDLLNHISKREISIPGIQAAEEQPMMIENLVIYTDDYGSINEWALLGFSKNVLQHIKVVVDNVWMNNPPKKILDDVKKSYDGIITERRTNYEAIEIDALTRMAEGYSSAVIGQDNVIKLVLSSLYSLKNSVRKKPATILFLGESGVGKTETAKFISSFLSGEMVRIQFSMQQTSEAYQYIFGAEHGENCLARELIRRDSKVILLDEFDKVHSSFYNAFYQMFDEGVFVDANYSVDVSGCIIICTTNYLNEQEAENKLGSPIFSRFSKVVKFSSISVGDKLRIAEKCYESSIKQLNEEDTEFIPPGKILSFFSNEIRKGRYRNMRMLKSDIEDAIYFEILKARGILK